MKCMLVILCFFTSSLEGQLIPRMNNILPNVFNLGENSNTVFVAKSDDPEYANVTDGGGIVRLARLWMTVQDTLEADEYNPDKDNLYRLYTRDNPDKPQVITLKNVDKILNTNFRPSKRSMYLIHGWITIATSQFSDYITTAILRVMDANVFVVDWTAGGNTINYPVACLNANTAGKSIARFINRVQQITGNLPRDTHIIGHSLGVHVAGIAARNLREKADYLTGLDAAAPGWITSPNRVRSDDAVYTEFIHTGGGGGPFPATFLTPLGQVDFYPNGGVNMPGCSIFSRECDHFRSTGLYYFETNADPPFSKY